MFSDDFLEHYTKEKKGEVVQSKTIKSDEQIRKEAFEEIEYLTGFNRKDIYKSNQINMNFSIKLKNNNLSNKEGYEIFKEMVKENKEKPIKKPYDRLNFLIKEKVNGVKKGYCPDCNHQLLKHAKYCTYCGEKIINKYQV